MKNKKIFALLTAILLTFATMAGCGGKGNDASTSSSGNSESSSGSSDSNSVLKYMVSFDTDGGSEVPSLKVEKWGVIEKPEDPVKSGYNFVGWHCDGAPYDFSTLVTKNVLLKAQWRKAGIDFNLQKNAPLSFVDTFNGEIQKVELGDIDITADVVDGQIAYDKVVSYGLGVHALSVETTEQTYTLDLTIATHVISDTDSFASYYREVQNTKVRKKSEKVKKAFYVVVAEDFTYTGDPINVWPAFNGGYMGGVQAGVFDGRGHIISGIKTPLYTLFSAIQGTIKNVAFVDFEAQGTKSYGLLSRFIWGGRLENVYISGRALNGVSDIIAGGMTYSGNAPVIKNCVFNVDFGATQGAVLYNSADGEIEQTTIENVYAITSMKSELIPNRGGWEVFPYADVEFFGFIEMYMQNSLFFGSDEHLYFSDKKLF